MKTIASSDPSRKASAEVVSSEPSDQAPTVGRADPFTEAAGHPRVRADASERAPDPHRSFGRAGAHENGSGDGPAQTASRFDPSRLRLNVDFGLLVGATKNVLAVQIRKPTKFEWVQCSPDEQLRLQVATLTWKEDRDTIYVVDPDLWASTPEIVPTLLVTTVNRDGVVFLLPIRLPAADGRPNEWHRTLLAGAHLAMEGKWVRFVANMSAGGYDVYTAPGDLGDPSWPTMPFNKLLEIALRDRIIADRDHPVLRKMRGEV